MAATTAISATDDAATATTVATAAATTTRPTRSTTVHEAANSDAAHVEATTNHPTTYRYFDSGATRKLPTNEPEGQTAIFIVPAEFAA